MARKSNGWLIVNIGPSGVRGALSRTVREKEEAGNCDHCGRYRKVLFSYDDAGFSYCNRSCWTAHTLIRAGVRRPSRGQVAAHNHRKGQAAAKRRPVLRLVRPDLTA